MSRPVDTSATLPAVRLIPVKAEGVTTLRLIPWASPPPKVKTS